jgi:hypothetical protein
MATTAKGFRDRQRHGISSIGQIRTFGKIPYRSSSNLLIS